MTNYTQNLNEGLFQNEWSFIPTMFSGMTGITIGLIIGNYLGWI